LAYDDKPTIESIRQMTRYLQDLWSRTHIKWQEVDSYYQQKFKIWPDGMNRPEWLKPARSRSIVDHAVDHQLSIGGPAPRPRQASAGLIRSSLP